MSNVIVLLADEHNPIYSEPYGSRIVKTPNMRKMADEGVVFENAYCPSPLCMPSRSAFLTGKRVHEIQTYSNCNLNLETSHLSFGASLSIQGVHTAYIGKTHAYAMGKDLGFDEMIFPGDVKPPGDTNHRRNPMAIRKGAANRASEYGIRDDAGLGDTQCVEKAVQWLHNSQTLEREWVLIVNIRSPHFPHFAQSEFWDLYNDINDMPEHGIECESAQHPHAKLLREHFETERFTKEQILGLRRGYYASVSFVDSLLGRLLDTLEETGMRDTTNILYTSDHGEMLGKFGMWWKSSLYEDSVRIPMIAAGPDFAHGERVSTPVDLHDLRATLFDATQTRQPDNWLGAPLTRIPPNDEERVVFSEYHGHGANASSYMIRKGKWKYIHHINAPDQLFDLEIDPEELSNMAESESEIVLELNRELNMICLPELENNRAEKFIEKQSRLALSNLTNNARG